MFNFIGPIDTLLRLFCLPEISNQLYQFITAAAKCSFDRPFQFFFTISHFTYQSSKSFAFEDSPLI
jgi:hypothetical protein